MKSQSFYKELIFYNFLLILLKISQETAQKSELYMT
jgi:hypothetical protein